MNPEAAEAIRIADKHLPNADEATRLALALDIMEAIIKHAWKIAAEEIKSAFATARETKQ